MKNNTKFLTAFLFLTMGTAFAQTGVGTTSPDASAVLDVSSTTKGLLLPRLTAIQRNAIINPAKGLIIFNTTANELQTNTGTPSSPVWTSSGLGPQGPQGLTGATGPAGANGISAYQSWLNAGNTGTEAQFLSSIVGATGATGATGPAGANGISAYQSWLNAGNTGTEAQFLSSIVGATGATGANGISAYQSWLNAGNTGTEAQFLSSIVGATGATGATGPAGANGISAYQSWLNAGNTGTEAQFLSSIVGAAGPAGATGPQGPAGADGVGGVSTAGTNVTITGAGTVASPYVINATATATTASNGLTATSGDVKLGGTLTAATTVEQGANNLTFSGTGRTIVSGSFQTQGLLYAKPPRVHPIANAITWQDDDVVILLQSTHTGQIVFPSASANPNRLIGINNRSGAGRSITNVTGGDTGIYANEALSAIASASGVAWFISDGTSWRLYSGRP
ncbi:hypothetical protein [Flavobacterium sp.]|jgi:hypothetical protein|uniref:hypothetical protein n=1 Tax=Flavobacterium sp. TaxID=239 RepID=UPI0037C04A58